MNDDARPRSDLLLYIVAFALGLLAGWVDVKVSDLLFTSLLVLAAAMALGVARPKSPWRWSVLVAAGVPLAHALAYFLLHQVPYRSQMYGSLLEFLPAIVGAYGGSLGRGVINNIFGRP